MTVRYGDISDTFGQGAANIPPSGGGGIPSLRDALRASLAAISPPYATTTALTASKAADRVDGQLTVTLDAYSLWVWKATDTTGASSTVIVPTDVGAGAGRWVRKVA